jgi:hypothetical protein
MKAQLILTTVICFLCVWFFFGIFVDAIVAQEDYFDLSISGKNYERTNINDMHNIIYYDLGITLENSGTIESDDITVRIMDRDGNYTRNGTIMPGVSKTFLFGNHPLIGLNDHTISIYFYPTDRFVPLNEYNHGEDTLILKYDMTASSNDNTPGFESVFLFILIVLYVMVKKCKK